MGEFLSDDFFSFTELRGDRLLNLQRLLDKKNVPYSAVTLAGTCHLIVSFPPSSYHPLFTAKTILAHYDRAAGSPGANDNSAAVYMLVSFAAWLLSQPIRHNIRIIFTGGEETSPGMPLTEQGAFALGRGMKKLGIDRDYIFVLDCCGRGDTLIVSETGLDSGAPGSRFALRQRALYEQTCALCGGIGATPDSAAAGAAVGGHADAVDGGRYGWMSLPVPYGDNAGLAAAGVPSQLVTILPHTEALRLAAGMADNPQLRQALIAKEARDRIPGHVALIPLTWQLINTANDTPETLTQDAFLLLTRFLNRLATVEILKAPVKR